MRQGEKKKRFRSFRKFVYTYWKLEPSFLPKAAGESVVWRQLYLHDSGSGMLNGLHTSKANKSSPSSPHL